DGLGRTRLFLKMKGNLDNPSIKYDTEQLKDHWKKELKEEKKEVRQLLKEEFGIFKKDSAISTSGKTEEDLPLQIEWGEEDEGGEEEKTKKVSGTKDGKKSGFGKFMDKIAEPHK